MEAFIRFEDQETLVTVRVDYRLIKDGFVSKKLSFFVLYAAELIDNFDQLIL